MKWTRDKLVKEYVKFFEGKGHKEIINSSLIPENDPTVLFTTAGMHPLVPFLLGGKHPSGKRLVNVQRCIRTGDINEVGDDYHVTFFEMLGNWSLGDYWKKEVIEYTIEFLTKILNLPIEKLAVSVFAGDSNAVKDKESAKFWLDCGIKRVAYLGKDENWWGPAGETGPCGPDTEVYFWNGEGNVPDVFDVENSGWVEIWNNVLMQYNKDSSGDYNEAKQKNVDTGVGLERTLVVLNGLNDVYEIDGFKKVVEKVEAFGGKKIKKSIRIVVDHLIASVFILGDEKGVVPSNLGRGYVLRRLIRRAIRHAGLIGIKRDFCVEVAKVVIDVRKDSYPLLKKKKDFILDELMKEEKKFRMVLEKGLKKFNLLKGSKINGKDAFVLFSSYGFPIEMTLELAKEKGLEVDVKGFEKEFKKHQEISRTGAEQKFKSGLADNSEEVQKLHTATHLLHSALRKVLGNEVEQKGSNITSERLRFDFNFDRKLSFGEIEGIERLVNEWIQKKLDVVREEMGVEEAKKKGAIGLFDEKYVGKVSVYFIKGVSCEICTGPHVENTSELGKFKIVKESSSAAGVRRIKAVLE